MSVHIIFANISWYLLFFVLLIRPLLEITRWKFFALLIRYRKYLGIIAGLSAMLHAVIYLLEKDRLFSYWTTSRYWSFNSFWGWGNLALFAMLLLLLTSNRFSQKLLKRHWKTLQRLAYPAFIFTGVHVAFAREQILAGLAPVFIWLFFWSWAKIKKSRHRKSLIMAVEPIAPPANVKKTSPPAQQPARPKKFFDIKKLRH